MPPGQISCDPERMTGEGMVLHTVGSSLGLACLGHMSCVTGKGDIKPFFFSLICGSCKQARRPRWTGCDANGFH